MDDDGNAGGTAAARPLLKWTGGKSAELAAIRAAMAQSVARHIEPFVGGGAVMFSQPPGISAAANDRCADLIALYRCQASLDPEFLAAITEIESCWILTGNIDPLAGDAGMVSGVGHACRQAGEFGAAIAQAAEREAATAIGRKRRFIRKLGAEPRNGIAPIMATALKTAIYTAIRSDYNASPPGPRRAAMFWFLREFAYGGMFRTNARGGFNIPYGGQSYNGRSMAGRLAQLLDPATRRRLASCTFHCGDFEAFLNAEAPSPEDFVFLDPPYDSPFSTYDGNAFTRDDHRRLARCMAAMDTRWMLVISETDFVRENYLAIPRARATCFDKTYQGHILNRNQRNARHLVITNYPVA